MMWFCQILVWQKKNWWLFILNCIGQTMDLSNLPQFLDTNNYRWQLKVKVSDMRKCTWRQSAYVFVCLIWLFMSNQHLSVIKGRVFLDRTSTKLGFKFLLKSTAQWRRWGSNSRPFGRESSTLPLSHSAKKRSYVLGYQPSAVILANNKNKKKDSSNLTTNGFIIV